MISERISEQTCLRAKNDQMEIMEENDISPY